MDVKRIIYSSFSPVRRVYDDLLRARFALVFGVITTRRVLGRAGPDDPWIVRWVGIHGRAAVIDGFRAQLEVPGFVAVDLAEPVVGAAPGQPCRGIGTPDVDRIP
jgi:hypothetical protein